MKTSTAPGPRGAHARPRALQNDKNNNNDKEQGNNKQPEETEVPTQAPTQWTKQGNNDKEQGNNKQQDTAAPTQAPTQKPTQAPTPSPITKAPTLKPSISPILQATSEPTESSTEAPTIQPTQRTASPTEHPITMPPILQATSEPAEALTSESTIQPTQSMKSPTEQSIIEVGEYAGQLSLVFSLYAPDVEYYGMESVLSELMTALLCSRPSIRFVSSRELINECPFEPPGRRYLWSHSSAARWLQEEEDITYLWNTLHVAGGVQTLEDDVDAAGALYYTWWNFSYPVLEWGEDGQDDLQDYLDELIGTQRVDEVLPWENAKASIMGQEEHTFLVQGHGNNHTSRNFDDPVPQSTADLFQMLGGFMLVANTVFVILITWLARRQRKTFAKLPPGLVTAEGVESLLLETREHVSQDFVSQDFVSQDLSQHSLRAAPRPAAPVKLLFPKTSPTLNQKKADEDRLLQEATIAPRLNSSPLAPPHHSHGLVYHDSLLATKDAKMEDDDNESMEVSLHS